MTKTSISGESLRLYRTQRNLSQRALARRVAQRLGRAEASRALAVRLHRIETGDKIAEEDRELFDALAAELALGEEELSLPPKWTWFKVTEGRPSFVALGLRQIVFTSAEKAYDARDALALAEEFAQPFRDAQLVPIHGEALTNAVLDTNFGAGLTDVDRDFLLVVDPDPETLRFLWTLQVVLGGGEFRAAFERGLAKVYDTGDLITHTARFALDFPQFQSELFKIHHFALRRLHHAPPEAAQLLDQWKQEEQALFEVLTRLHEVWFEHRGTVVCGDEPEA